MVSFLHFQLAALILVQQTHPGIVIYVLHTVGDERIRLISNKAVIIEI